MMILASDFDDTLYFLDDKEKTKKNIEAIRKFTSSGNTLCIITGRNYTDLKQLLIEHSIPYTYLICEDGAKIFNGVDYCLDTIQLEKYEVEQIVKVIEDNNWDYYLDDGYSKTQNYDDCVKVVVECDDKEKQKEIVDIIKNEIPIHVYASRSHINIINKIVNKANAIKRLFNIEKLDYSKLKVIGDNDNDYEMINEFNGVIVGKHHEKLDTLNCQVFETLSEYIEELMKN